MPHVIEKEHFHVEMEGSEAEGLSLQRTLPALCRDWVNPAMEAVLDRLAPPGRHLVIERLEVNAGAIEIPHLERDLAQTVAQALERSLRQEISRWASRGNAPGMEEKSAGESVDDALAEFLKSGFLPWWFHLSGDSSFEEVLLRAWQKEPSAPDRGAGGHLVGVLAFENARRRLILQFSPLFLETLLARLSPRHGLFLEILGLLRSLTASPVALKALERELWDGAFASIAQDRWRPAGGLVSRAFSAIPAGTEGTAHLARELERIWPDSFPPRASAPPKRQSVATPATPFPTDFFTFGAPAPSQPDQGPEAKEGIYVGNAGMVLLHPFMPQCFEALGIAEDGRLVEPGRALALLHFLATGQETAPEYELMLFKVLCNVPLPAPVESDVGLTQAEREEGEALLRAVIGHWEALRDASPDGLRGTFLLRPGKLMQRGDGDWLLQVEHRTCDILLGSLPWGIAMVRLPWMEGMLRVEWTS